MHLHGVVQRDNFTFTVDNIKIYLREIVKWIQTV
jgi:hypothetical protein